MTVDIGNSLSMSPCDNNIWSFYGAEFGPRWGTIAVVKRALY